MDLQPGQYLVAYHVGDACHVKQFWLRGGGLTRLTQQRSEEGSTT